MSFVLFWILVFFCDVPVWKALLICLFVELYAGY
jgi:hypothetical protein